MVRLPFPPWRGRRGGVVRLPFPPWRGRRGGVVRLPFPPVEGETLLHDGVNPLPWPPVSTEIEYVWRCGVRRRRGRRRLTVPVVGRVPLAPVDGDGSVGERVEGGSTRPGAEQCGTTVRHRVIPSGESIGTQCGADVRMVKDRQGGRQATRSTDRRWPVSRSAGSVGCAGGAGSARSGWCLRGAGGNSPRALAHVAATNSGCGRPTGDGLRPCHAPTDDRRGQVKFDSSDVKRPFRYGRRINNLDHRLCHRLEDLDHWLSDGLDHGLCDRFWDWLDHGLWGRLDHGLWRPALGPVRPRALGPARPRALRPALGLARPRALGPARPRALGPARPPALGPAPWPAEPSRGRSATRSRCSQSPRPAERSLLRPRQRWSPARRRRRWPRGGGTGGRRISGTAQPRATRKVPPARQHVAALKRAWVNYQASGPFRHPDLADELVHPLTECHVWQTLHVSSRLGVSRPPVDDTPGWLPRVMRGSGVGDPVAGCRLLGLSVRGDPPSAGGASRRAPAAPPSR